MLGPGGTVELAGLVAFGEIEKSVQPVCDVVDRLHHVTDGGVAGRESFEDGLGDWVVLGAPEGSVANANDWERVGVLFEIASIVATEDTLLFGFGFEGIETADQRNEVMRRSLLHLLG